MLIPPHLFAPAFLASSLSVPERSRVASRLSRAEIPGGSYDAASLAS